MTVSLATNSRIVAAFRDRTAESARLAAEAREMFPSGIVHDSRRQLPHGIYVDRADGSRKWDVDGNEYVDYVGGHGALLLGHGHPAVKEAVHRQYDLGTHPGACHQLEVRWASLIKQLVPCAERIRFHSSGTEANLMALRLARAYTGRTKLVHFTGHFHGWSDHVAFGVSNHLDGSPTPGVLEGIAENVILAPPDDLDATRALIESRDDIAAVILEPTGATWGQVPLPRPFVAELRRMTAARGILLIFDEVVCGFRDSVGGAQEFLGITPDLCSLAKILAGGLPGGAVCGRKDILDLLDFDVATEKGFEKIGHQGTYNANPLSAAAGIATLEVLASTDACARANATGARLRDELNVVFADEGVPWAAYGQNSGFFIHSNPEGRPLNPLDFDPTECTPQDLLDGDKARAAKFQLALQVHGVDVTGKLAAKVSAAHTDEDVTRTTDAAREAVRMMRAEGDLPA